MEGKYLSQSTPLGQFRGGRATQNVDQRTRRARGRFYMNGAQADPQGPVVMTSGECRLMMYGGPVQHEVKQTWAPHARGLKLITKLIDVMKGKRETVRRKGVASVSSSKKRGSDSNITCPVIAIIAASQQGGIDRRTRTAGPDPPAEPAADPEPQEQYDWRDTSQEFVSVMRGMAKDALLECLAGLNVPAAEELQVEREETRELQAASRKALADATKFHRTNEGRRTYQMLLTAAALDGDDGPSRVTAKRKAEILGVHPRYFMAAGQRAKRLTTDILPSAAMGNDTYWFNPRSRRSDGAPPELVELMKRFWHTDGISRATDNSANRDSTGSPRGEMPPPILVGNS